ncbi:HNH endonuclease [Stenotrophomonas pavanii]
MWLTAPSELGLKASKARAFQCTAEHLVAQQDGGRDVSGNVVAAHSRCNQGRHQRKDQPLPLKRSGRWFRSGWQWGDGGPDCHQGSRVLPYGPLN